VAQTSSEHAYIAQPSQSLSQRRCLGCHGRQTKGQELVLEIVGELIRLKNISFFVELGTSFLLALYTIFTE
jgi:hypothetical protein